MQKHVSIELVQGFEYEPQEVPIREHSALDADKAIEYVKSSILPRMGKGSIERLRTEIKSNYLCRFRRPKIPKYGSLSKAFSEQQLNAFLNSVENEKYRLLFRYMATLGLRIGEAVRVNVKDIDFESRELKIRTEKARQ